jgi:hypothetical protein
VKVFNSLSISATVGTEFVAVWGRSEFPGSAAAPGRCGGVYERVCEIGAFADGKGCDAQVEPAPLEGGSIDEA